MQGAAAAVSRFSTYEYEEPKDWIRKQLQRTNHTVEEIRLACRKNREGLSAFLAERVRDDFWPPMTPEEWGELTDECCEAYQQQLNFKRAGSDGVLTDTSQDNMLGVPQGQYTCWQLYRQRLEEEYGWKEGALVALEGAAGGILRKLSLKTEPGKPVRGLVVGNVQSGKTANMEALMAMAADHGWNMFIILSGSIENLRIQTLDRIDRDLNAGDGNLHWYRIDQPAPNGRLNRLQSLHLGPGSEKRYFTVCLKNKTRLQNLIGWLHSDAKSHGLLKILIIDDEADQAGISNTAVPVGMEEKERRGINELIVRLAMDRRPGRGGAPGKPAAAVNYIMYTATPYANFLNESTDESLFPRDFIWMLRAADEYIGPQQIFGSRTGEDREELDITRVIPEGDLEKIRSVYDGDSDRLPDSMKDAVCWFIAACAVMRTWGWKKPVSMLIHTSQKQVHHDAVAQALSAWLGRAARTGELFARCRDVYRAETARVSRETWMRQIGTFGRSAEEIRVCPPFAEIEQALRDILSVRLSHIRMDGSGKPAYTRGLHLVIDNCSKNGTTPEGEHVRLVYPDMNSQDAPDFATLFIIIGGSTLSRGLTLEGLVSTFFLRGSAQADSLMQMGRWFGFRRGYELLPRIWMTEDTIEKFRFLAELDADMREDIRKYERAGVRPQDYPPAVRATPKLSWLRLTSRKHMVNAVQADMDFTGVRPQTILFDENAEIQQKNIEITERFLAGLGREAQVSPDRNSLCWRDVPVETVIGKFLRAGFRFAERARGFNETAALCSWLEQLSGESMLSRWSVIAAGAGEIQDAGSRPCDAKHWEAAGKLLGKVNRSRLAVEPEGCIAIGVLRSLKDHLADLPGSVSRPGTAMTQEYIDAARKEAGMDQVPMLLIYRIDGQSKAARGTRRKDMNFGSDIIGIQLCIPGGQKKMARKLTVRMPARDPEDDMEEQQT